MKTILKFLFLTAFITGILTGCGVKNNEITNEVIEAATLINAEESITDASLIPPVDSTINPGLVTQNDINKMLFMREEEKLANNVYAFFNNKFKRRVFENIAKSEVQHQNAIIWLIELFKIEIPGQTPAGVFSNEDLQALYNRIIQNSVTVVDAFKAGAYIEEHDILDLKKSLSETQNEYIKKVYTNLMNASCNHLRAFVANLRNYQINYVPAILSQEEFNEIISK
ncbi:MAG: DUF2202 domain-containing protein [Paludibacteraceae bacterium]